MPSIKNTRGPTREQLTDQQWQNVSCLFETIERIGKRLRLAEALAKGQA